MHAFVKKIRLLAKKWMDYGIEGEYKIYRVKHTPVRFKMKYTSVYHKKYEKLPVQRDKIIFDNYKGGGFGCNCKYVLLKMLEQGIQADYVWVLRNPEDAKMLPQGVRTVPYGSEQAMEEYATAGVWVNNFQMTYYLNRGLLKKPEQTYIQMWHGSFGIKKIEGSCDLLNSDKPWLVLAEKNAQITDYWISNSSFETQVYKEAFWGAGNILEYGHPRNDIFFGSEKQAESKVKETYGITDEKIVLYVPTFRDQDKSRVSQIDADRLTEALKERFGGEWVFALRQHPRMVNGEVSGFAMDANVCDVTGYPDIQELLAASDAVITDYSSAIFDFMLTGRPAFLLAEDYEVYEDLRGLYYPLEDTPFPLARSQEELRGKIKAFDEQQYRRDVEAFLEGKGSVEDGKAAERVAGLI
nr:CDP-glycerol glycerophosphotransferase family protein [Lachnospiraceae bacterium]